MNTTTTLYPATVREAAEMAEAQGMKLPEFLEKLGTIPQPPAGYTDAEGVDGIYVGREIETAGVVIVPAFNYRKQEHFFELWTGKGTEDEAMVILSPAEAVQVAANLSTAAKTAI